MDGWIKLHRKITDWEWWGKPEMIKLLILFICKANIEDKMWQGLLIKRGQFVSSLDALRAESGFSIQKIRTCLKRFENTQEITIKSTNKYSIVTVCNYESYQISDGDYQQAEQQTSNKQITNNQQQLKNIKNIRKKETTTKVVAKKDKLSLSPTQNLEKRCKTFYESLVPFVGTYGSKMVREFYDYWSEPNKSKTKMRFELQQTWEVKRRLVTWSNKEKINSNGTDRRRGSEVTAASAEDYKTSF